MNRKKVFSLLLILTFTSLTTAAFGKKISLGSAITKKKISILPGGKREVKIPFFNYGNKPLSLNLKVKGEGNLGVSIFPRNMVLEPASTSPSKGGKWIAFGDSYLNVREVNLKIKVPELKKLDRDEFKVKVEGVGKVLKKGKAEGISEKVSSSIQHTFIIEVPGEITNETKSNKTLYFETIEPEKLREKYGTREGITGGETGQISKGGGKEKKGKTTSPTGYALKGGKNRWEGITSILGLALAILFISGLIYKFVWRK